MTRPIQLNGWYDLCALCDEPARWATSAGRVCNLHAVTEHVPTPDADPAWTRIQRANDRAAEMRSATNTSTAAGVSPCPAVVEARLPPGG